MSYNIIIMLLSALLSCRGGSQVQQHEGFVSTDSLISVGAEQVDEYLPLIKNKRIALVVNQTSTIGKTHLVDSLLTLGVKISKILAPEHGFRGDADAGEHVANSIDKKTNIPLVSIYGKNKKPTAAQLKDVDVIIFDIQDVGARFFTYISTMHYIMESCAENNIPLIILDRPNPNGHYIDGPILQPQFKSFIGMHPIPIVHGLTVAELAQMINGEKWLENGAQCSLKIIKNKNYSHSKPYSIPIKPSPNLPNDQSIKLYPSVCLFEGTPLSLGRGTTFPFQVVGGPDPIYGTFQFTPVSIQGMAKNPPLEGQLCYGIDLREVELDHFTLQYVIDFYKKASNKDAFFTPFFDKLAGNKELKEQIKQGMTEDQIKATWEKELTAYKTMRKKYALYQD